jgi:hypothetical protein
LKYTIGNSNLVSSRKPLLTQIEIHVVYAPEKLIMKLREELAQTRFLNEMHIEKLGFPKF